MTGAEIIAIFMGAFMSVNVATKDLSTGWKELCGVWNGVYAPSEELFQRSDNLQYWGCFGAEDAPQPSPVMKTGVIDQKGLKMDEKYAEYRKVNTQWLRPYTPGEDMTGISVGAGNVLEPGGMVAVDSDNEADKWYVPKPFFEKNYEPA